MWKRAIHLYWAEKWNEIPNEFSVCVISCRYQLHPLLSIDTVYYSVDTLASLLLKVILLLKMKFLCKLWTSNLGSPGSPVNFLHQLESEKVPLDTISHLSPLPVTNLLWYQKRAEWAVSLNASMFNVTMSSHGLSFECISICNPKPIIRVFINPFL